MTQFVEKHNEPLVPGFIFVRFPACNRLFSASSCSHCLDFLSSLRYLQIENLHLHSASIMAIITNWIKHSKFSHIILQLRNCSRVNLSCSVSQTSVLSCTEGREMWDLRSEIICDNFMTKMKCHWKLWDIDYYRWGKISGVLCILILILHTLLLRPKLSS